MSANPDRVPTDAELLASVAEGDPEAFGVLYDQHVPWLLLRAAAVLGTATLLAAAASLALPQFGPRAAGWLLPSLGLTASSLALATTVEPLRAIGITAGAWVIAVAVTVLPPAPSSVLFALAGQVGFAALALLAAAVLLLRRGHFESDRGFDTTPRFAARRLR